MKTGVFSYPPPTVQKWPLLVVSCVSFWTLFHALTFIQRYVGVFAVSFVYYWHLEWGIVFMISCIFSVPSWNHFYLISISLVCHFLCWYNQEVCFRLVCVHVISFIRNYLGLTEDLYDAFAMGIVDTVIIATSNLIFTSTCVCVCVCGWVWVCGCVFYSFCSAPNGTFTIWRLILFFNLGKSCPLFFHCFLPIIFFLLFSWNF